MVRLKREAMELYKQGRIEDPNLLEGFLAQITDLRIHLVTLIQAESREGGRSNINAVIANGVRHDPSPVEVG